MSIEIRRPTEAEMPEFHRVLGDVFGSNPTAEAIARYEKFHEPQRLRAAFDDDCLVATHGTYSLELTVPGNQIAAGGTTAVTVSPTHRRRGIFRRLMTAHLQEVRENEESVAMLWASEFPIYGRFGFGLATDQMSFELDGRDVELRPLPPSRGSMQFVDKIQALTIWPAVFDKARQRRPGMFRRWPGWWEYRLLADPECHRGGGTGHKRVVYTRDGEPAGYALYRLHRRSSSVVRDRWLVVEVIELMAIDDEAELALWRYLFSIDLVGVIRSGPQPPDSKLLWWLKNQRSIDRRISDAMWVRIVDLPAALAARKYARSGDVVFSFDDETCPWNNGSYRLAVNDFGEAAIDRVNESADVKISPQALGAIYLGGRCLRDLAAAGLASGPAQALAQIDAMFAWYPAPWCQEIF